MEIPPKNNRETTKSGSPQKLTRKRNAFTRIVLPVVLILIGVILLVVVGIRVINTVMPAPIVQDVAISDVLNMADRHQIKSVMLSGNDVFATSRSGQQFHSVKEDGQAVTEIFRKDNVSVSIDSSQRVLWGQWAADLLLVCLAVGGLYLNRVLLSSLKM